MKGLSDMQKYNAISKMWLDEKLKHHNRKPRIPSGILCRKPDHKLK